MQPFGIFKPIAVKLERRTEERVALMGMVMQGISMMCHKRSPALMRETLATVKRYKQYYEERNPESSFNPFTVMRHCLYLGDKQLFRRALRNTSREAFEAWLQGTT